MQIWLESGSRQDGVDLLMGDDLQVDGAALYINQRQVGRKVDVSNSEGQAKARSMAGSVEWILLDLGEWKMIPIENIIAVCDGGPTKVAARISSPEQVLGAAFALQLFGQRNISAAPAAIVMSLEGVVAAISAWIILNQILGMGNIIGCTLILVGILLSQLAPIYEKNYK